MRIYPVNKLPDTIIVGRQTEYGVAEVRLDCAPWLALWPDMAISVWVTPPGGAAAYPAATHMEGDVLVWTVNAGDTAKAGTGTMEVMGIAEGKKKLSAIATTRVLGTTTGTTAEPPEASQAWVDQVLDAATRAEEAADRAMTGGGEGGGGSYGITPQMYGAKADGVTDDSEAFTKAVAAAARADGVLVLPAGTYLVHDVTIPANLRIMGDHAIIQLAAQSAETNQFCNLFNSTEPVSFEMHGVTVRGLGAALTEGTPCSVLDFSGAESIIIEDCAFESIRTKTEVGLYAIIAKAQECDRFIFRRNTMREVGGFELMHVRSKGLHSGMVDFSHNVAEDIHGYTWNLAAGTVRIENNRIVRFRTPASMFNLSGESVYCGHNNMVDCLCSDVFDTSESGGQRALHLTVEDNTADCVGAVLTVFSGTSVTVRGNKFRGKALFDSCNVVRDSYNSAWDYTQYVDMDSVIIEGNTCKLGVCSATEVTSLGGILSHMNRFGVGIMNPSRYVVENSHDGGGRVKSCVVADNVLDYSEAVAYKTDSAHLEPVGIFDNIDSCTIDNNTFINPPKDSTLSSVFRYGIELMPYAGVISQLHISNNRAQGDLLTHYTMLVIKPMYVKKAGGVVCTSAWITGNTSSATITYTIGSGGAADGYKVSTVYGDFTQACALGQDKLYKCALDAESSGGSNELTDETTGTKYRLCVNNAKLTLEVIV